MAPPGSHRRSPRFTIIVMVVLSITVITLDARDVPVIGAIRRGVMRAVTPVGDAMSSATTPFRNAWNGITNYGDLESENQRLRKQLDALSNKDVLNSDAEEQVKRLKEQLKVPFAPDIPKQVAQVSSGNFSSFDDNTAQIDKGSESGLKVGMPVVTAAGLIGSIEKVYVNRSVVRLITDPGVNIGIKLKSDDLGVGRGTGAGKPWLVDRGIGLGDDVAKGDPVTTSGLERAKFPAGLPIGTVRSITRNQADQIQILEVNLVADLSRLDYVQVLLWEPAP